MDTPSPSPTSTLISRLDGVTAISRRWPPGRSRHCTLCEHCSARDDCCLLQTTECVTDALAPSFGIGGVVRPPIRLVWHEPPLREAG